MAKIMTPVALVAHMVELGFKVDYLTALQDNWKYCVYNQVFIEWILDPKNIPESFKGGEWEWLFMWYKEAKITEFGLMDALISRLKIKFSEKGIYLDNRIMTGRLFTKVGFYLHYKTTRGDCLECNSFNYVEVPNRTMQHSVEALELINSMEARAILYIFDILTGRLDTDKLFPYLKTN